MIGSLHGTVELFDGSHFFINVHGVGYRVQAPTHLLSTYHVGDTANIFTYTHVREDSLELFGFATLEDLKLFEMFLSVSGIGPKTALGIFGVGTRDKILSAIQRADVKFFTGVPRLGTKNAQKLIIELKGKLGSLEELDLTGSKYAVDDEVGQALLSFGFSQREIDGALTAIGGTEQNSSQKIKLALKYLGK